MKDDLSFIKECGLHADSIINIVQNEHLVAYNIAVQKYL